jgi:hypothetical protein
VKSRASISTQKWPRPTQCSLLLIIISMIPSTSHAGLGQQPDRVVAVLEFLMETCLNADCKNQTTGTVNPGIACIGKFTELGFAAEIPVNPRSGAGPGVFALFHLFIDDLFPESKGRPIFP